jgi:hypothetical protein
MSVHVQTAAIEGCQIVTIEGFADEGLLGHLAVGIAAVAHDGTPVVVDLDGLWLAELAALRCFLATLRGAAPDATVVLCCSRISGRRILRRWGGPWLLLAADQADAVALATAAPTSAPVPDREPALAAR